jgi:hypothetical protein
MMLFGDVQLLFLDDLGHADVGAAAGGVAVILVTSMARRPSQGQTNATFPISD